MVTWLKSPLINQKTSWKIINEFRGYDRKQATQTITLKTHEHYIYDQNEIAKDFNQVFISVGQEMRKGLNSPLP